MGGPAEVEARGTGSEPADEGPWEVRSAVRAPEIAYHPGRRAAVRRGPADPVKVLMHRHRDLCERAVDPLEIAAGLEAHGLTDRTAARYRHRDVFSLAEELYARVPAAGRSARAHHERPGRDTEARGRLDAHRPAARCRLPRDGRGAQGHRGGARRRSPVRGDRRRSAARRPRAPALPAGPARCVSRPPPGAAPCTSAGSSASPCTATA